eukprot:m.292566 g.292566  ORF g.292566 m.292566 type:complete len:474 (+) comp16387_c0_seq44:378-1799(+)
MQDMLKAQQRELLRLLHTIFVTMNISYCISDDTLLGHMRGQTFFVANPEFNIRIRDTDMPKLLTYREGMEYEEEDNGYTDGKLLWDARVGQASQTQVVLRTEAKRNAKERAHAHVSLASFHAKPELKNYTDCFTKPLELINYDGVKVYSAPHEIAIKLLDKQYGRRWESASHSSVCVWISLGILFLILAVIFGAYKNWRHTLGVTAIGLTIYILNQPHWVIAAFVSGINPVTIMSVRSLMMPYQELGPNECFIPKKIVLTYKDNDPLVYSRMKDWSKLNPDYDLVFFNDTLCYQFLKTEYGAGVANIFNKIRDGPIKSDYFRVHYLYAEGGIYVDVDMVPLKTINSIFTTTPRCSVAIPESRYRGQLNPTVIIAPKKHPIIGLALRTYQKLSLWDGCYSYWSWSVVHILSAIDHRYRNRVFESDMIEECDKGNLMECYIINKRTGVRLFAVRNTDYDQKTHSIVSTGGSDRET